MSKIFLDSNILIYLHSQDETNKKSTIESLFLVPDTTFIISTQVVFEFIHVMRRKFKLDYLKIETALTEFSDACIVVPITIETLRKAMKISQQHSYSFPDSLIIASACENQCATLLSEDMQSGQVISEKLQILNPFMITQ